MGLLFGLFFFWMFIFWVLFLDAYQFSYPIPSSAGMYCHSTWNDGQVDGEEAGERLAWYLDPTYCVIACYCMLTYTVSYWKQEYLLSDVNYLKKKIRLLSSANYLLGTLLMETGRTYKIRYAFFRCSWDLLVNQISTKIAWKYSQQVLLRYVFLRGWMAH